MLEVKFDFSDFERKARELGAVADQIPFALANAMTAAAFKTRDVLVNETWPAHVEARNRSFIRRALRIEKAIKRDLQVEIYDDLGRGNLKLHAKGGTRVAQRRNLAIPPSGTAQRKSGGAIKAGALPKALVAKTPKRALRITPKGIFVGEGGRLRLKYALKQSAQINKDVPFYEDFQRVMRQEIARAFPTTMRNAMKTRR
ncbi:hypothetical protein LOC51_08605 [Rubrivivax sp. JA1024]|nr:hypothetical protein [Rubrivivax sp. JA1024]